jgi:hypothetical protein
VESINDRLLELPGWLIAITQLYLPERDQAAELQPVVQHLSSSPFDNFKPLLKLFISKCTNVGTWLTGL